MASRIPTAPTARAGSNRAPPPVGDERVAALVVMPHRRRAVASGSAKSGNGGWSSWARRAGPRPTGTTAMAYASHRRQCGGRVGQATKVVAGLGAVCGSEEDENWGSSAQVASMKRPDCSSVEITTYMWSACHFVAPVPAGARRRGARLSSQGVLRPRSSQPAADQVQVRQRDGGGRPRRILGQPAVAGLLAAPEPLHHLEGVFSARPHPRPRSVERFTR